MNTNKLVTKSLVAGIIVLFFAMSIIPSIEAGNTMTGKNNYAEKTSVDINKISNTLNNNQPTVKFGTVSGREIIRSIMTRLNIVKMDTTLFFGTGLILSEGNTKDNQLFSKLTKHHQTLSLRRDLD